MNTEIRVITAEKEKKEKKKKKERRKSHNRKLRLQEKRI